MRAPARRFGCKAESTAESAQPDSQRSMRKKTKLQAARLEGNSDDIEAAFYDALQRGDIDRLMACWADEDEIFCIHPGGPRVVGATAIRATFESMFSDGGTVRAWPERARKIVAVGSAVHNVLERVE